MGAQEQEVNRWSATSKSLLDLTREHGYSIRIEPTKYGWL